ncbi:MAG: tRNA (N(6)-L-threonylcarbamoyladenosine(37)-C(2))-methylthiotransferase MtaB [Firmicutes bacterium]|nr:tRNA (N(6)-L-threonylcarbamoyladenosine(37)-C(2))-methylthiotransferase MtaB [Bacillota bacterium]
MYLSFFITCHFIPAKKLYELEAHYIFHHPYRGVTMSPKVAFYTLGCKVNYYDTEALKSDFRREGFKIVDFKDKADVYVVNTCTVTHQADRKSRQYLRRAKRRNPQALVVALGCYVQTNPDGIASLPEVDLLLGTMGHSSLPQLLKRKLAGESVYCPVEPYGKKAIFEERPFLPEQGRTRAFLKIQEGCNQFCSYCIIPFARGPLRSLPLSEGKKYLQEISRAGYKEVVLTGIHLGLYGTDLVPRTSLAAFLEEAASIEGLARIRLSSIEPTDLSDELIGIIQAQPKICRHLHIPLQSGDDTILKKMGRPYDSATYATLLKKLRDTLPDLAVSSDLMVGFPGEDDVHFRNSLQFVRDCSFSRLHVFKYSLRPGTRAAAMAPQVSPQLKEKRSREMSALGEELLTTFQQKFLGRKMDVLFEKELKGSLVQATQNDAAQQPIQKKTGKEDDRQPAGKKAKAGPGGRSGEHLRDRFLEGLTSNYLRVRALAPPGKWRGKIGRVHLTKNCRSYLQGIFIT